jgi:hypothetical protein
MTFFKIFTTTLPDPKHFNNLEPLSWRQAQLLKMAKSSARSSLTQMARRRRRGMAFCIDFGHVHYLGRQLVL